MRVEHLGTGNEKLFILTVKMITPFYTSDDPLKDLSGPLADALRRLGEFALTPPEIRCDEVEFTDRAKVSGAWPGDNPIGVGDLITVLDCDVKFEARGCTETYVLGFQSDFGYQPIPKENIRWRGKPTTGFVYDVSELEAIREFLKWRRRQKRERL